MSELHELQMEIVTCNPEMEPASTIRVVSRKVPGGTQYLVEVDGLYLPARGSMDQHTATANAFLLAGMKPEDLKAELFQVAARKFLAEAVQVLTPYAEDPERNIDAVCHRDLASVHQCGRCVRAARAWSLKQRIQSLLLDGRV